MAASKSLLQRLTKFFDEHGFATSNDLIDSGAFTKDERPEVIALADANFTSKDGYYMLRQADSLLTEKLFDRLVSPCILVLSICPQELSRKEFFRLYRSEIPEWYSPFFMLCDAKYLKHALRVQVERNLTTRGILVVKFWKDGQPMYKLDPKAAKLIKCLDYRDCEATLIEAIKAEPDQKVTIAKASTMVPRGIIEYQLTDQTWKPDHEIPSRLGLLSGLRSGTLESDGTNVWLAKPKPEASAEGIKAQAEPESAEPVSYWANDTVLNHTNLRKFLQTRMDGGILGRWHAPEDVFSYLREFAKALKIVESVSDRWEEPLDRQPILSYLVGKKILEFGTYHGTYVYALARC